MIDFNKIKLIIWDLDDTFWNGTLSESIITVIDSNINLIKSLTDRGIVNSICSKNDLDPVINKLKELGIYELFVFISVDWTPKGNRISSLISEMGLRPANTLFIDDNIVNLNEAKYFSEDLLISDPTIIPQLIDYIKTIPVNDFDHSRLKNYKILEEKRASKNNFSNNIEFLYSTKTKVHIKRNCLDVIDRIYELIQRTNQLNYTKNRSSLEELKLLFEDRSIDCGYVCVEDKFGDYGITGFYAIKNNKFIHFLFSCRTIGQGVEQYVYSILNFPNINIVGEVVSELKNVRAPEWINSEQNKNFERNRKVKYKGKIVFKGPCDLEILTSFLESESIIKEFTYISNERHNSIEHHNHSINYLSFPFLPEEQKEYLVKNCIFNDKEMFDTAIYDNDVKLIFLSTLIEPNLGIYKNNINDLEIAFGEWFYPLTDESNWNSYINKSIANYQNDFTREWLQRFSEQFSFKGRITPERYIENVRILLYKINPKAKICLILGSEAPYSANKKPNYEKREVFHKELNDKLRNEVNINNRILLLDFNEFLSKEDDFWDNINHFQRNIYLKASKKANEYISQILGEKLIERGKITLFIDYAIFKIIRIIPKESRFFRVMRFIYRKIRSKK